MQKILFVVTVLALMAACAPSGSNSDSQHQVSDMKQTTVQVLAVKLADLARKDDPFCEMTLEEGHIADTAIYEGKTYGFCSSHCKDEFRKDPATYAVK